MPPRPARAPTLCCAALLCGGCAVIELSSDAGCSSYLVLGFASIDLRHQGRPAALAHVSQAQLGLYGQAGAGARAGIGYTSGRATLAQSGARGTVDARVAADGSEQVRIDTIALEGKLHEESRTVVCMRGGLSARRLRE